MFHTRCKYSKHVANVSNALLIFATRFKCFKRVANIQNTLQMLAPPGIPNALLIPEKSNMRQVSSTVPIHVIGKEIISIEVGKFAATIDGSTNDAPPVSIYLAVGVVYDRKDLRFWKKGCKRYAERDSLNRFRPKHIYQYMEMQLFCETFICRLVELHCYWPIGEI